MPLDSVLIANRGEIAVRIIRACRARGVRAVAVYSDADAEALHVRLADAAYRLGPPPAAESYLDGAKIVAVARQAGVAAVHPGYGFLAESPEFAERVEAAGLIWIGPSPEAMRLLGDKASARALAERVGVPVLPGYHGADQSDQRLRQEAAQVGFPLLVKAAAGGGGRGIRRVQEPAELDEALAAARREAQAAFGDDRLLLERYLSRARHVEMQVFGDRQGTLLYLGERDCSIQRRHQKVLEEAPAPGFSDRQRQAMGQAAVALGRAAGYVGAGTVEFLLDQQGRFYFLEVNARLQVEHPVTELLTGLDLVGLQLEVAAGQALPLTQPEVRLDGHAIEARLYAEDPLAGYVPSSGELQELRLPAAVARRVRVDAGYEHGDTVSSYYDSLLVKLVVWAPTRSEAVDRLAAALGETVVTGPRTNLEQLIAIVASEPYQAGVLETGFLAAHRLEGEALLPPDDVLLAAAAAELLDAERAAVPDAIWTQAGPWRPAWIGSAVWFRFAGRSLRVGLRPARLPGERWRFELPNGQAVEAAVRRVERWLELERDGRIGRLLVERPAGETSTRLVRRGRYAARLRLTSGLEADGAWHAVGEQALHAVVRAPLPGRVARVAVATGQQVSLSQTLVVLEAMKVEHLVGSPRDGLVERVACKEGDQVEVGAVLVELEER